MSRAELRVTKTFNTHLVVNMMVRVCGAAAGLLLTIYAARIMDADEAGRFFWASNLIIGFSFLCKWGLDTVLMRLVALDKNNSARSKLLLEAGIKLVTGLSLSVAVIGLVGAVNFKDSFFPSPEYYRVYTIAMLSLIPISLLAPVCGVLRGQGKQGAGAFVERTGQSVILLLLIFILAQQNWINENNALLANMVAGIVVFGIGLWMTGLYRPMQKITTEKLTKNDAMLKNGSSIVINNLAGYLVNWWCGILLAWYASPVEVAVFVGAQRLSSAITIIFALFISAYAAYMPILYAEREFEKLQQLTRKGTKNMILMSLPLIIPMLLFPEFIMGLLGDSYSYGANFLVIMVVGQIITCVSGMAGSMLAMAGKEHLLRNIGIAVALIVGVLSIVIIPKFGSLGAAVVTMLGMIIQGAAYILVAEKSLNIKYLR